MRTYRQQCRQYQGDLIMKITVSPAAWLIAFCLVPLAAFANGGGSMPSSSPEPMRQMTPAEIARSAYNDGVRLVKKAQKYEETAASATKDDKKAKALGQAGKQYEKARQYFAGAISKQAEMYEAWNYIGYTSRKLGEYDKALAAYDEALRLKPDYSDAIEYRGEAYLGLNRVEDAKQAYMSLFGAARPLADQLMAAMQRWVAVRRTDAAGVSGTDLDTFAQWISERTTIAQQTASLAVDGPAASQAANWK